MYWQFFSPMVPEIDFLRPCDNFENDLFIRTTVTFYKIGRCWCNKLFDRNRNLIEKNTAGCVTSSSNETHDAVLHQFWKKISGRKASQLLGTLCTASQLIFWGNSTPSQLFGTLQPVAINFCRVLHPVAIIMLSQLFGTREYTKDFVITMCTTMCIRCASMTSHIMEIL